MKHVLVLLLALAALPARAQMRWQSLSKQDRQRDAAKQIAPVPLELRPRSEGAPLAGSRPLRVRVYAAQDYRDATMHWQARFRRLVAKINDALAAWPGVQLEIVELKPWPIDSKARHLDALVGDLEAHDAGEDVDFVIGLVAAVPKLPESMHELAMARVLGRHFVLRSLHDLVEVQAVHEFLDELPGAEKEALIAERKLHKEECVFLHELGHMLGAIHVARAAEVMNPVYSESHSRFAEPNARIVQTSLKLRIAGAPRAEIFAAVRKHVESVPDPEWEPRDREQLLRVTTGQPQAATATFTVEERKQLEQAFKHYGEKRWAEASEVARPIFSRHANDPQLATLWCDLQFRLATGGMRISVVEAACKRAAALSPAEAWPLFLLADAQLEAKLDDQAQKTIVEAEARATNAERWGQVAALWQRANAPSLAVAAAKKAEAALRERVEAWAASLRRQLALPEGAVEPARESEYLRLLTLARESAAERRANVTSTLIAQLQEFSRAPGAALVECERLLHARKPAKAPCERVVAMQEDSTPGRLALAFVARAHGDLRGAAAHLRRVIETEPSLPEGWKRLAEVYRASGARRELQDLEAQHRARFGGPLP